MSKLKYLLLLMLSLMLGCSATIVPIDTSCLWVKPISTTENDRKTLSRGTKLEIAAHNDLWDSRCGQK